VSLTIELPNEVARQLAGLPAEERESAGGSQSVPEVRQWP